MQALLGAIQPRQQIRPSGLDAQVVVRATKGQDDFGMAPAVGAVALGGEGIEPARVEGFVEGREVPEALYPGGDALAGQPGLQRNGDGPVERAEAGSAEIRASPRRLARM